MSLSIALITWKERVGPVLTTVIPRTTRMKHALVTQLYTTRIHLDPSPGPSVLSLKHATYLCYFSGQDHQAGTPSAPMLVLAVRDVSPVPGLQRAFNEVAARMLSERSELTGLEASMGGMLKRMREIQDHEGKNAA